MVGLEELALLRQQVHLELQPPATVIITPILLLLLPRRLPRRPLGLRPLALALGSGPGGSGSGAGLGR